MKTLTATFNQFIADDSGQDLIEYALIASAVGLIAVAAFATLSTAISGVFTRIAGQLS